MDANDKKGKIRQRSTNSTGDLVELAGEYHGEHYDLLKVDIGTGGGYGTATFTVSYLSNDQLEGAVTSAETITGGLQHIFNGLYGRFQGNQFHVNAAGYNIKSKGFYISGQSKPVYITDVPDQGLKTGVISLVQVLDTGEINVIAKAAGTVDYIKGEIMLATVNITSTLDGSDVVEIQAIPESNDVVGLRDLYLNFSISESTINMVRDVISSGDEITGTSFIRDFYTSSYLNGKLIRE